MMLIGLAGVARSGKDTAAEVLAKELGLYRYAFADPIKRMLEPVFGDNFVAGDRERIDPTSGVSYRRLMQTLGTEWGRNIQPDLWTRVAKAKWEWVREGCPEPLPAVIPEGFTLFGGDTSLYRGMVISDVRFDNEAEWIRSEGGIIVHIERPDAEQVGLSGHASEAGLSKLPYDLVVKNDGSLKAYHARLDFVRELLTDTSSFRPAIGVVYEVRPGG